VDDGVTAEEVAVSPEGASDPGLGGEAELDSEGEIREGELEDDWVTAEEVAVSSEGAPVPA
jgi:hypothetical protein